jgi:DNA-binding transcriptional regulator YiaG
VNRPRFGPELPDRTERRSLREAAGIPAYVLAARIGVSPSSIHAWEVGEREPTGLQRRAYRRALMKLAGYDNDEARSRWSNDS